MFKKMSWVTSTSGGWQSVSEGQSIRFALFDFTCTNQIYWCVFVVS